MNASQEITTKCGAFSFTLLLLLVFFGSSFKTLKWDEWGLRINGFQKVIYNRYYAPGRYVLGMGHKLVAFPRTYQTIEFDENSYTDQETHPPIVCRTADGLPITLEISFQYRLNPNELYQMYNDLGQDYYSFFVNGAHHAISHKCTEFMATEFFQNRTEIGKEMHNHVRHHFEEKFYSNVSFFQLREVDLPDEFEAAIVEAEVSKQLKFKASANKTKQIIFSETRQLQSRNNATIFRNNGAGDSNVTAIENIRIIEGFQYQMDNYIEAYSGLMEALQLTPSQLIDYIKISAASKHIEDGGFAAFGGGGLGGVSTCAA